MKEDTSIMKSRHEINKMLDDIARDNLKQAKSHEFKSRLLTLFSINQIMIHLLLK